MKLLVKKFFRKDLYLGTLKMYNKSKDSPTVHELSIEVYQDTKAVPATDERIPNIYFHLFDNESIEKLSIMNPHVVLEVNYNSANPAHYFVLGAQPGNLRRNFSHILKWSPEHTAQAIRDIESYIALEIGKRIFSRSKGSKMQYHSLIKEFYEKGLTQK